MKLDALQLGKFAPQKNNQLNGISFLVYAQLHAYNMQVLSAYLSFSNLDHSIVKSGFDL